MSYDSEKYVRDAGATWLKVARTLRQKAVARAENGHESLAVKTARLSDYCFWQATGEGELAQWNDLFPAEPGQ